jgi:site-specific DNA recombinase
VGRVAALLTHPETVAAELTRLEDDDPTAADLAIVDRSLAEVTRQQRNLVDQLADLGGAAAALVREKLEALERRAVALAAERETILARREAWQAARARLQELQTWCANVAANLSTFDYRQKRLALDALGVQARV